VFTFLDGKTVNSVEEYCTFYYEKKKKRLVVDTVYRRLKKYKEQHGSLKGISNMILTEKEKPKFWDKDHFYDSMKAFVEQKLGKGSYAKFNSKKQVLKKKHPEYSNDVLIEATLDTLS
jgi:hypothetical protein